MYVLPLLIILLILSCIGFVLNVYFMYRFYMRFLFINDIITMLFIDVIVRALYIFEMYLTLNVSSLVFTA